MPLSESNSTLPSMETNPELGLRRPAKTLIIVVFPEPERPNKAVTPVPGSVVSNWRVKSSRFTLNFASITWFPLRVDRGVY